jgi:hypothetical protein
MKDDVYNRRVKEKIGSRSFDEEVLLWVRFIREADPKSSLFRKILILMASPTGFEPVSAP